MKDAVELRTVQFAKGISAANECKRFLLRNGRGRGQSHDVLSDDIIGFLLDPNRVEGAFAHEFDRGLHQVVDVRGDQDAVAVAIERMTGAPNALNRARNAFWRRHHYHEINRADIDAQLQAGRTNHRA